MDISANRAGNRNNREFYQQREDAVLRCIPGVQELLTANNGERAAMEQKYPDAVFALNIISNPFVPDRELGAIRLEAYSAILSGESVPAVHYKYDRQMEAYVDRHNWD